MGVLLMYIDGSIADKLRKRFGSSVGLNASLFFEEWRNYGLDEVMQRYPQRTFYKYLDMLIDVGLVVREGYGSFHIASGYEDPVRIR